MQEEDEHPYPLLTENDSGSELSNAALPGLSGNQGHSAEIFQQREAEKLIQDLFRDQTAMYTFFR